MAMTWPQIINKTDKTRKMLARYVRLTKLKTGRFPNGNAFVAARSYSTHQLVNNKMVVVPASQRTEYVTLVEFIDKRLNVLVSCSCPDFMYRAEVALHKKGAAEIDYSNGDLPHTTNPKMIPHTCKHICCLYDRMKDKLPK